MPTSQTFRSVRHDTGSSPIATFTPPEGTEWDLTEPGIVARLVARLPGAATPKINGLAVVVGPWSVRYDPAPDDVNTIGVYDVQVEVTRADGKKITLPTADPADPTETDRRLYWRIVTDLDNS